MNMKEIIYDYYQEIQKAFKTKQLDCSNLHLANDICVIGPNESFAGKETVETMLKQFVMIVNHFDFKRQYFDQDSACTILDCVTNTPAGTVPTMEWMLVKNGRITEIHLIYDTAAWAKVS